jgi:serine/threonine-protein kinase
MIGSRLGPWVIDRELGRGGMGCVYLAHADPPPADGPARAAVKVLAAELSTDPGLLRRFHREIEVLQKLDHPGIVRFLGSGEQDGRYYFAMEYVEGPSYQELLERQGKLPWEEVLLVALRLAPALKHAHDRGVIHRDLKPSNLLRAESGESGGLPVVKLTDFGIASLFASAHLTLPGGVVGTAEYLSPEQAVGKPVTRRSDLYSLGAVLYTLVTGRTPFEGEPVELLHKHVYGRFDRPGRLVPELPAEFDDIICQLLEKDPAKRPADGGILARRLESLLRKQTRKATPVAETVAPSVGPATLASRLVRAELEREKEGGPVRRLFNSPWVLVPLFLLTLGVLVWTFWPLDPEAQFQRGAALMDSNEPDDWYRGWHDYLEPFAKRYPEQHAAEMDEFRRRMDEYQAARDAAVAARGSGPMSEAQWFYQLGLRLRQQGDEDGAKRVWRALRQAFHDVPSELPWVRKAKEQEEAPAEKVADVKRQWGPVREALRKVKELREAGKKDEADAIERGLRELYENDPDGLKLLKE